MELSLVETIDIPEPFKYCNPRKIQNLFIKSTPESAPTSEILFENVIIEYKSFADQERELRYENSSLKITYLKTYVSVGIPTGRYRWLLRRVSELTFGDNFSPLCNFEDNDYTWISAQLPVDDAVYEEPKCYVYDEDARSSAPVGTVYDVLTQMKSNLVGCGQFKIRRFENFQNRRVISLLLTGFQILGKTDKQSYPKPCVPIPATADIKETLKRLNLDSK